MKQCTKCLRIKPINEFHSYFSKSLKRTRIKASCKMCCNIDARERVRAYYASDKFKKYKLTEKYKKIRQAINKRHRLNPDRIQWTKNYEKTPKMIAYRKRRYFTYYKEWMKTERGRSLRRLARIRLANKYPLHIKARNAVYKAVESGLIKKPSVCSKCLTEKPLHAHHHKGYSPNNWLNIVWLCQECHSASHKINK